jgi:hypothetical protein
MGGAADDLGGRLPHLVHEARVGQHHGEPPGPLGEHLERVPPGQGHDRPGLRNERAPDAGMPDAQMHGALDRLLTDPALGDRLARGAAQIQSRQGLRQAADLIENAARQPR